MAKPKAATMTRATKNGALHARQNNTAGDWFRVGILSATVVAPLMARWNELRVAERAKALSGQATKNAQRFGARADEQTRELRAQAAVRARELSELAAERSRQWAELARACS